MMPPQTLPTRFAGFETARSALLTEAARIAPDISVGMAEQIARDTHDALRQIFSLGGVS